MLAPDFTLDAVLHVAYHLILATELVSNRLDALGCNNLIALALLIQASVSGANAQESKEEFGFATKPIRKEAKDVGVNGHEDGETKCDFRVKRVLLAQVMLQL